MLKAIKSLYAGIKMKIAVLVSGGVDSSVALHMLKSQGHDVTAFYLKIWLEDELAFLGECPWEQDLSYVRAVCEQLQVPLEIVSMQKEYWQTVVAYTISEIKAGRTPNPDMLCNQFVKFGFFLDKIDPSFQKVASGHYAQIHQLNDGTVQLGCSPDVIKDQTYFLARMSQRQLQRVLFPMGNLDKSEIRVYAHTHNLPNKNRKDSQGICFLGKLKFKEFVEYHLGKQDGNFIEFESGVVVGRHDGYWFYTIGQRQGLGLAGGPWYVVSKDCGQNTVFISRNYYSEDKQRNSFFITGCNWIGALPEKDELQVKLRHGAHRYVCQLRRETDTSYHVTLLGHDQGIAQGQFAVFYDGDICLGSGMICYSL